MRYARFQDVLRMIIQAGRNCIILKRDVKDAFWNALVASHQQLLLGFMWKGKNYKETCLSLGLSTSPFIFNLFGEVLLESERFEAFRSSRACVFITRGCSHVKSLSILPSISLVYEPGRRAFTKQSHQLLQPLRHSCTFFSRLPSSPTPFI